MWWCAPPTACRPTRALARCARRARGFAGTPPDSWKGVPSVLRVGRRPCSLHPPQPLTLIPKPARTSNRPIGILAEDAGGVSVARALQRLLPREDLLLLCDDAYAPYARRRPAVVAARVASLLADLRADGAKLIVIASPQAVLDSPAAQEGAVALIRLEAPIPQAGAACGGGAVAAVVVDGSVRPRTFGQALRRQRGASAIHVEEWALDGAAVAERVPELIAAGVGALALTSPALSRLRPAIDEASGGELPVIEAGDVAAARVQRTLRHAGLLARRRRPGRLMVLSSNPSRATGRLAAR
jgi:glutamate racemase